MENVIAGNNLCHCEVRSNRELCVADLHDGDCFVPRNDKRFIRFITVMSVFLFITAKSFAQTPYDNTVFRPEIKSVEFYNTAKQASFPIITLGSDEKVLLAFDNLHGGTQNYSYTLEHCDANWNSSNLSPIDYLQNYMDDRVTDYSYSTNTVQKYTHYQLKLPNENIAPKIAGNYILKVYEDGDQSKMVLTRRLYVVKPNIAISAEIVPSSDNATRQSNQKINFTLDYGSLPVQNPGGDLRTFIMQNARGETAQLNTQPTYIRGTQLIFNDVSQNDFPAGNEFRHFDTRTFKLNSINILHIYRDTANTVILLTDPDLNRPDYTSLFDLNGSFYILNQDGVDPRTDADYAHIYFTLATKKSPDDGTPYIAGQFNDYKLDGNSKMIFDPASGKFAASLFLKQGVYDYTYVWTDKAGKADDTALEGSHFETENDYQILVYYRPPSARWEELIGYKVLNTVKK
ncbi:MAG: DUF5103 domain-containing protein [Sphingobacteriales bacterium]